MTICKICGKEYKNLGSHIKKAHDLSKEEYEGIEIDNTEEEFTEIEEPLTPHQITLDRFGESIKTEDPDRPLSEFLAKYAIDEKELIEIVNSYKGVGTVNINKTIKEQSQQGLVSARLIAEKYDKENLKFIEVEEIYTAEALNKELGFHTTTVTTRNGKKVWVLSK